MDDDAKPSVGTVLGNLLSRIKHRGEARYKIAFEYSDVVKPEGSRRWGEFDYSFDQTWAIHSAGFK